MVWEKNHENVSSSIMIPLDHKGIFYSGEKESHLKWQFFPIYLPIANCYDFHKFKISKTSTITPAISLEFFPTTWILIYLSFPIASKKWECKKKSLHGNIRCYCKVLCYSHMYVVHTTCHSGWKK